MSGPFTHRGGKIRSAGKRNKKRLLVATSACALVFLMVVPGGCGGGDRKEARGEMNRGDTLYQNAAEKASEWETRTKSISGITDPAAFNEAVVKSRALADETLKVLEQAGSEYKKIYDISGVKDYKEYADIRISEIDVMEQLIKTLNDTLGKAVALSDSADTTALAKLYLETNKQIESLTRKGQSLENEAATLRQKKEL
jgi:hypothetical protein